MRDVIVVGGGGFLGSRIVAELLSRGRRVTCAGRDPATLQRRFPSCRAVQLELSRMMVGHWATQLVGMDAVVNQPGCFGAILRGCRPPAPSRCSMRAPKRTSLACCRSLHSELASRPRRSSRPRRKPIDIFCNSRPMAAGRTGTCSVRRWLLAGAASVTRPTPVGGSFSDAQPFWESSGFSTSWYEAVLRLKPDRGLCDVWLTTGLPASIEKLSDKCSQMVRAHRANKTRVPGNTCL